MCDYNLKSKQQTVINYLIDKYSQFDWITKDINSDSLKTNNSLYYDCMIELDDRIVIIEIEHNQYKNMINLKIIFH